MDQPETDIIGLFPASEMCKDMDDECNCVADKMMCQMYDPQQGKCPYVYMHPEFFE